MKMDIVDFAYQVIEMNERIKELALQAKLPSYVLEYGTELCLAPHLEKFAELIVRECAELTRWKEFDMSVEQRIRLSVYQDIKEHFGVKE